MPKLRHLAIATRAPLPNRADGNNIDLSVHGFDTVELKTDREKKTLEKVDS